MATYNHRFNFELFLSQPDKRKTCGREPVISQVLLIKINEKNWTLIPQECNTYLFLFWFLAQQIKHRSC